MNTIERLLVAGFGPLPFFFTPEWLASVRDRVAADPTFGGAILPGEGEVVRAAVAQAILAWGRIGVSRLRYAGPLRSNPFQRGTILRVESGVRMRRKGGEPFFCQRTYPIRVSALSEGGFLVNAPSDIQFVSPTIGWSGSGGVRMELDLNDLPLRPDEAEMQRAS